MTGGQALGLPLLPRRYRGAPPSLLLPQPVVGGLNQEIESRFRHDLCIQFKGLPTG